VEQRNIAVIEFVPNIEVYGTKLITALFTPNLVLDLILLSSGTIV